MPGTLTHSPAKILAELIIGLGLGTDPTASPLGSWPVYSASEPDLPDNCITVYDTQGIDFGTTQYDGEKQDREGVQIRVRATTSPVGWTKADAIAKTLDPIKLRTVSISGTEYTVWDFDRTSGVLPLGNESPTSKRKLFTVNATISVRQQ